MEFNVNKFKEAVGEFKNIVFGQTQARTNKLKPFAEIFEEATKYFDQDKSEAPVEAPPVEKAPVNEDLAEELAAVKKENKYLKRKQTMYDLKIAKLQQDIKDLKKIKGVVDPEQPKEEQVEWI
jgi:hypothetical protein